MKTIIAVGLLFFETRYLSGKSRRRSEKHENPNPAAVKLLDAAMAAYGKKDLNGSLSELNKCLKVDPSYLDARMTRSTLHIQGKDYAAARKDLDETISRARARIDDSPEPWDNETVTPWRRILADALSSRADLPANDHAEADMATALLTAPADWRR